MLSENLFKCFFRTSQYKGVEVAHTLVSAHVGDERRVAEGAPDRAMKLRESLGGEASEQKDRRRGGAPLLHRESQVAPGEKLCFAGF
jgi:hypothetical protein